MQRRRKYPSALQQRSSADGLSLNSARVEGTGSHLATKSCQLGIIISTTHITNIIYNTCIYMCIGELPYMTLTRE